MKVRELKHEFVRHAPENLKTGVLYVSMEFATVIHACCCGCGKEVITPLSPTDWKIVFDGESISLTPSVGNWNFPCRSHYIIKRNQVIEALPWSDEMVKKERQRDSLAKARLYGQTPTEIEPQTTIPKSTDNDCGSFEEPTFWGRMRKWWRG